MVEKLLASPSFSRIFVQTSLRKKGIVKNIGPYTVNSIHRMVFLLSWNRPLQCLRLWSSASFPMDPSCPDPECLVRRRIHWIWISACAAESDHQRFYESSTVDQRQTCLAKEPHPGMIHGLVTLDLLPRNQSTDSVWNIHADHHDTEYLMLNKTNKGLVVLLSIVKRAWLGLIWYVRWQVPQRHNQ